MINLNKENFFNAMQEKYPETMERFLEFIDSYKVTRGWELMFGCNPEIKAPKFHEIPYELQIGVICRFLFMRGKLFMPHPEDVMKWFEKMFEEIEEGISKEHRFIISKGANLMFRERVNQILVDGYDSDHDKSNNKGELANVAVALLTDNKKLYPKWWTKIFWKNNVVKPRNEILIIAGALLAAEYDRLEYESLISSDQKNKPEE